MDPYRILGVAPGSQPEEIKKQYRELVKQYHPDLHPEDEDAARKMSEINSAYEQIRTGRTADGSAVTAPSGTFTENGTTYFYRYEDYTEILRQMFGMDGFGKDKEFGNYAFVDMYIKGNNLTRAAKLLDTMPRDDARWYYYAAQIYRKMGDHKKAVYYARTACVMDPMKMEYSIFANETEDECAELLSKRDHAKFVRRMIAGGLAFLFVMFTVLQLLG